MKLCILFALIFINGLVTAAFAAVAVSLVEVIGGASVLPCAGPPILAATVIFAAGLTSLTVKLMDRMP